MKTQCPEYGIEVEFKVTSGEYLCAACKEEERMEYCPNCGKKTLLVSFGGHQCVVCGYRSTDK